MTDIYCKNFNNMPITNWIDDELKAKRFGLYNADKNMLTDSGVVIDLENISNLPVGRFKGVIGQYTLDMFFSFKPDKPLYVILNGFLMGEYPQFKRWSWYKFIDGSVLNIADPMLLMFQDLKLGWYYGTKDFDIRQLIAKAILSIRDFMHINNSDIIIYGSSGGGAACFEVASLIKGSLCVAINAQLFLETFSYYNKFKEITGVDAVNDKLRRNDIVYWVKRNPDSRYIIVDNVLGKNDRENILSFAKLFEMDINYGINKKDNVIIWCYAAEADDPHNAQEDLQTHFQIMFLKNLFELNSEEFEKYKSLYLMFSEIWYAKWKAEYIKKCQERNVIKIQPTNTVVFEKNDIVLAAKDFKFNAYIIPLSIKPNTHYCVEIYGAVTNETRASYTVGIKDNNLNGLSCQYELPIGDSLVNFYTGKDTSHMEFKIYSGIAGKTQNIGIKIDKIIIKSDETLVK